jgi:hypothetical protein
MAFSATEAAFEGFRLVKREPKSVLAWAAVQLVFGLALTAVMVSVLGPLQAATLSASGTNPDPVAALQNVGRMFGVLALLTPVYLIYIGVVTGAVYRAVLRPEEKGLARLKLGADELRLVGTWLLMGLLYFGMAFVLAFVAAFVTSAAGVRSPLVSLLPLLVLLVVALIGVRLSFAGPMTFAERKIRLLSSWRATKGKFWPLLGCYVLAFIFVLIIYLVLASIGFAGALASAGGSPTQAVQALFRPQVGSLQSYFTPVRLGLAVVSAGLSASMYAIMLAPAARAYKDIAGVTPQSQADAFS